MVSFLQSSSALIATLLASLASTEAAYGGMYVGHHPLRALAPRMLPALSGTSFFPQDIRRVMHDVDEMFNSVLGDMDEMFYEPVSFQRTKRPSHLLEGSPALNALVQTRAKNKDLVKNAYGITQDDKQLHIVIDIPGANAGDINLQLEDDGRMLKISGESKRETEGISMHSRFERSFRLPRDVNTSEISASIDSGVLTIKAPKYAEARENVRRIDVAETKKAESVETINKEAEVDVSLSPEKEESQEETPEVDESVIDLDVKK